jgi:ATP-binding cassette subfamily F protein 3
LWSREALADALSRYEGTILVVSHDRYFLNQLCDHILVLDDARARVINGNYDTYRMLSKVQAAREAAPSKSTVPSDREREDSKPIRAKRKFPYRRVEDIEEEIGSREDVLRQIERDLCNPEVLRDRERVLEAKGRMEQETERVRLLYEHLHEAIERN